MTEKETEVEEVEAKIIDNRRSTRVKTKFKEVTQKTNGKLHEVKDAITDPHVIVPALIGAGMGFIIKASMNIGYLRGYMDRKPSIYVCQDVPNDPK